MSYRLFDPRIESNKPKFWLAKPNKKIIARLQEVDELANLKVEFGKVNELSFSFPYYKEKDNRKIINPNIQLINSKYLIKMEFMGNIEWFTIEKYTKEVSDTDTIPIQAFSLQYSLSFKKIYEIEETSILPSEIFNKILEDTGWKKGYIDPILAQKYRSYTFSRISKLDGLYQVAETCNGILQFDTVEQTVSLYDEKTISKFNGLMINDRNYLESLSDEKNASEIVTRLYPIGSESLTINSVNPTGSSYLEDFSYFMYPFQRDPLTKETLKSSFYFEDDLAHAILDHQELIESRKNEIKTLNDERLDLQIDRTDIKNQAQDKQLELDQVKDLTDIMKANREFVAKATGAAYESIDIREGNYFLQMRANKGTAKIYLGDEIFSVDSRWTSLRRTFPKDVTLPYEVDTLLGGATNVVLILARIPLDEETESDQFLQDRYNYFTYADELYNLNVQIGDIDDDIEAVDNQLITIRDVIALENNFSEELLEERQKYIYENYWVEDNHVNAQELYDDALEQFKQINKPSTVLSMSIVNFLGISSEVRNWNKLIIGSKLRIHYERLNISSESLLVGIDYNFENNDISLSISDTKDLLTDEERLVKMIYSASSSSNYLALKKFIYDDAVQKSNAVEELLNETWDANKRRIVAGVDESIEISKRGIVITNPRYPNDILVAQAGVIAISNDGGESFKNAITTEGVVAERILGKILIGERLWIEDGNGIVTIRGDKIEIKDNFSQDRVKLGQYEEGKYGIKIENGALEIVGGLKKSHLSSDILESIGNSVLEQIGSFVTSLFVFDEFLDNLATKVTLTNTEVASIDLRIQDLRKDKEMTDIKVESLRNNPDISMEYKDSLYQGKDSVGDPSGYSVLFERYVEKINLSIDNGNYTESEWTNTVPIFEGLIESLDRVGGIAELALAQIKSEDANQIRADLRMTAPLPNSIEIGDKGITAYQTDTSKFARLDYRGLYVQGGAIDIRTVSGTNTGIVIDAVGIRAYSPFGNETFSLTNQGQLILKGDQTFIEGGIGTHIDSDGIYTGKVKATQVETDELTAFTINTLQINGEDKKIFFGSSEEDFNGRIDYNTESMRFQRDQYTYYKINAGGSSGFANTGSNSPAAVHQFFSSGFPIFNFGLTEQQFKHRTLQAGNIQLKFLAGGVDALQVRSGDGRFSRPIEASEFTVTSLRSLKKNIESYSDNALSHLLSTGTYKYHMIDDSDTELKRIGLIYDEVPADIASISGAGVNVYSMATIIWKALQQFHEKYTEKIANLEERIIALEEK